jgi:hypothetical protein
MSLELTTSLPGALLAAGLLSLLGSGCDYLEMDVGGDRDGGTGGGGDADSDGDSDGDSDADGDTDACGGDGAAVGIRDSTWGWVSIYFDSGGIACGVFDSPECPAGALSIFLSSVAQAGGTYNLADPTNAGVYAWTCDSGSEPVGTITIVPVEGCLEISLDAELDGLTIDETFTPAECGSCVGTGGACDEDADCCLLDCDEEWGCAA